MDKIVKEKEEEIFSIKKRIKTLKASLIGKTIKSIKRPNESTIHNWLYSGDGDNIIIEFIDGTIWKLSSWDTEEYESGIDEEIIEK